MNMDNYLHYRKYFEPEYGEAAPDALIMPAQSMDLEHPTESRIKMNFQTIAELTSQWQYCYCFHRIMSVKTVNTLVQNSEYDVPIRIYLPEGEGPFPVVVFYHGGGWMMNSLDVYDYVPRYLASYGKVLVIATEHRLAPENKFPKGLNDCYRTLEWATAHAWEYGGDPNRISVCGDSSGGNLATVVAQMARDLQGPKIYRQVLCFPSLAANIGYRTDSEKRYGDGGYFLVKNSEQGYNSYYFDDQADTRNPYASPLLAASLEDMPDTVFISAECDPLLDQSLMYAARLEDAGVNVDFHFYKGMVHAFLNRPQQKTFEALDVIAAAVR